MSERRIFVVFLSEDSPNMAHFELGMGGGERLFHISVRDERKSLVLNNMVDGAWGKEQHLPISGGAGESWAGPVLLDFLKDKVVGYVNGQRFVHKYGKRHSVDRGWKPSFAGLTCREIPVFGDGPIKRDGKSAEVIGVDLYGYDVGVPKGFPLHGERLALAAIEGCQRYLSFVGGRNLGTHLVVLDAGGISSVEAVLHALLMNSSDVYKLCDDVEHELFISKMAELNRLKNLFSLPRQKCWQQVSKIVTGAKILLQGEHAIWLLEELRSRYPKKVDEWEFAVLADVEQPISGSKIFGGQEGVRDISIRVSGTQWEAKKNSSAESCARRQGLDVAVAAYNAEKYIVECVSSLLCDGRDDVRVIVVDDGSKDGTRSLVEKEFGKDARVRVVSKPNGGCASARNYGRLVSNASHIAFVDADDFVSENFFGDLYDLALYTGSEIVQGGFDFFDADISADYLPSYEEMQFGGHARHPFGGMDAILVNAREMIKGQPTIWRRVYRRDFLDAKNIYFPENVRAYDDYIFHIVSLTLGRDVWMLPEHKYHYRQHSAQDVKAGDERHFYMIYMFHLLLRRSIDEGWPDFLPYAQSIIDSIRWSSQKLRADLVGPFLKGAARFCVAMKKVYGDRVVSPGLLGEIAHPDFAFYFENESKAVEGLSGGVHWGYFSGAVMHPDTIKALKGLGC